MILRRFSAALRAQNWSAVLVEIAIVVIGVFIGIEVSNWNAGRLEHDAARVYQVRLREELAANILDLQKRQDYYAQVRSHGLAALAAFDQPRESLGEAFLNDAYQASQIGPRSIGRSTYDEILSVGALPTIGDSRLRNRMSTYYQALRSMEGLMDNVPPYRDSLRRHMPYAVQQAIVTECKERRVRLAGGSTRARMAERCSLHLPPDKLAEAVAAVAVPEIKLDLTRNLSDIDTKLTLWQGAIERARALDTMLATKQR